MPGCDVLKNGLVWRVGDGRDVCNWGDKWLPTPISFLVQSPIRHLTEDARVMELIDQTTKWWNVCLVHEVFNEDEARILCQIPLSPVLAKDQLI